MILSRTRKKIAFNFKKSIFEIGGFQSMLDEVEARTLEDNMGFRGQWDEHRRFQFEFLKSSGLKPSSNLLEIGCGPLTLGLPAIQYLDCGKYTGIDVRANVLDLAHRQVGKNNLSEKNPRLICSNCFGRDELIGDQFDFAWSFSVLYHLSDELLSLCLRQASRRLTKDGKYFANVNTEQQESTWLQFPFVRRDLDFYCAVAAKNGLKMVVLGQLQDLGFRLDRVERLNRLLRFERVG